jgi:two-component system nitrate/nitrite response regulator NarL
VPIKLLIADNHSVVREGIKCIMEGYHQEFEIAAEARNGEEVLEKAQQVPADVYILKIGLPLIDGIETTERLIEMNPASRVILFSMEHSKSTVQRVFAVGARGYVFMENITEELIRAVREVQKDKYYLSPVVSGYITSEIFAHPKARDGRRIQELTQRQKEILELLCEEMNEKEIAEHLGISIFTVHAHMNNIRRKLDIHTRAGLIRYAVSEKIVPA